MSTEDKNIHPPSPDLASLETSATGTLKTTRHYYAEPLLPKAIVAKLLIPKKIIKKENSQRSVSFLDALASLQVSLVSESVSQ